MGIIVQVLVSLLILIGFVFSQLEKLKTTSLSYLLLNSIGALILGIDAFIGKQMRICFTRRCMVNSCYIIISIKKK